MNLILSAAHLLYLATLERMGRGDQLDAWVVRPLICRIDWESLGSLCTLAIVSPILGALLGVGSVEHMPLLSPSIWRGLAFPCQKLGSSGMLALLRSPVLPKAGTQELPDLSPITVSTVPQ